jgi:hypothetical protein
LNFDMFADDGTPRAKGHPVVVAVNVSSLEKQLLPRRSSSGSPVHDRLTIHGSGRVNRPTVPERVSRLIQPVVSSTTSSTSVRWEA